MFAFAARDSECLYLITPHAEFRCHWKLVMDIRNRSLWCQGTCLLPGPKFMLFLFYQEGIIS